MFRWGHKTYSFGFGFQFAGRKYTWFFRKTSESNQLRTSREQIERDLPNSFHLLSQLSVLDVSFNQLTGILSEAHIAQLSKVKIMRLSLNSFTLNVSSTWLPPFQIRNLDMGSCKLGPSFPSWLQSQKRSFGFLMFQMITFQIGLGYFF